MKTYFIIGAGGFAKEIFFLAKQVVNKESKFGGFIDYKPKEQKKGISGIKYDVYDEDIFLEKNKPDSNIDLYLGIGNPNIIKEIIKKFENYNFPNLYPSDLIWDTESIELGKGNIITNGVILTIDVIIGSYNIINKGTIISHDVKIGDGNVINPSCNISGEVIIGSYNLFGVGSTLMQQLSFGNNSILGASALLTKDGGDNGLYIGVPAKKIKNI